MWFWNLLFYSGIFGTALMMFATLGEFVNNGLSKDFFIGLTSLMVVGIIPLFLGFFKKQKLKKIRAEIQNIEKINSILRLAKTQNGILKVAEVSLHLGISVDEARIRLEEAVQKGICRLEIDEEGNISYIFPYLISN